MLQEAPASLRFDGEDDKKFFTQEDVNRFMAEHKKTIQQENAQLKKDLEEYKKELGEMKKWKDEMDELLEEASEELDDDEDEDEDEDESDEDDAVIAKGTEETKKAVEYINRKWEKRMKTIEKKLEESESHGKDVEQKRRNSERDNVLTVALQKAKAVDIAAGLKIFRENMVYDEEDGRWLFKIGDGPDLTPEEGVMEHIPAFLKISDAKPGSGALDMKGSQLASHIEDLKKRVDAADIKAKKTNDSGDIRLFQRAKAELKEAESKIQQK